ncbi:carbohydrate ABC transporter permease [soil metagenome]
MTHARRALRLTTASLVWVLAAVYSVPIYLLVVISLKTPAEIAECAFCLPSYPQWQNFADAWAKTSGTSAPNLGLSMINSAIITVIAVTLIVVIGAAAGWFLGRSRSRASSIAYLGILAAITLPVQLIIIPVYVAMSRIGVLGELVPVALFYVGLLTPFAIFLCTGFVRAIPTDFEEAAQLDGASQMQIFWHIVMPMLGPVLSTVAILTGIAVWNDFFGQLVFLLGSGHETLPLTVFNFASQYATSYNLLAAGLVIATIPLVVFYLLLQRRIVDGFAVGIKG